MHIIFPEIALLIGAILMLVFNFSSLKFNEAEGDLYARKSYIFSLIFVFFAVFAAGYNFIDGYDLEAFAGMFEANRFTDLIKIFILLFLLATLAVSYKFAKQNRKIIGEFYALLMLAAIGCMLLICSNNFLSFYVALELQSLSLYLLAACDKKSKYSSEAGLKYFILGSLASALILFGISLIYGFSGSIYFDEIAGVASANSALSNPALLLGVILVTIGLLFKISAAPFHMWVVDVYHGAPLIVTNFFAGVVKFISVMFLAFLYLDFVNIWPNITQVLVLVAVLSLIFGSVAGVGQTNIKRLMAYSSISHIGFVLIAIIVSNVESFMAVTLYMIIYGSLSVGFFAFLSMITSPAAGRKKDIDEENDKIFNIYYLAGIARSNPLIAACVAVFMFSMAGVPPLAGFFAKFHVLVAAVNQGFIILPIIAVICAAISAFYYLRIVKIIYFDEIKDGGVIVEKSIAGNIVLFLAALFNLVLIFLITPFMALINDAVSSIM